jgi:cell division protein FtsW (lipid II flippase)
MLAVGLLYARLARIPPRARPLLYLVTILFVIGALLATASNQRVDFQILAWHATWHIVGAFGFIALWAFNHVRFVMSKA